VALDALLIEVLVDPEDHGPLLYFESESLLYNPRRRISYEVRGAIPVLLPDEARAVSDELHERLSADSTAVTTGSIS
jgi:uncharacterized protein YbaR (Trm112 family)